MRLFQKNLSVTVTSRDSASAARSKNDCSGSGGSGRSSGGSGRSSCGGIDEQRRSSFSERRLTRQRKLRYATDEELGLNTSDFAPPLSPARQSSHVCNSPDHWSTSATPHPLPLPDSPLSKKLAALSISADGCSSATRNKGEQISMTGCQSAPICKSRRSMVGAFGDYDSMKMHTSPRSAPTSGFSSPMASPSRPNSGDVFFFNHQTEKAHEFPNVLSSPTRLSPEHRLLPSSQLNAHPLPLPRASPASPSTSPRSFFPSPPRCMSQTKAEGQTPLWQKGRLIGRGTYGTVYHGTHRVTGASCAIKEVDIIPEDRNSVECVKQLEQEINVLSQLVHPNIVRYYGSEMFDDHLNIYLEYVHPGSLSRYVKDYCGTMTESVVRNFTRHILSGLAYLHSRKTVHRDIKGANLLVDQLGTVKLADFGTAKHLTGLSSQLSLKGSPHWMAPEVMKSVMKKDSHPDLALAVDIWSLGCTVIEMFTGKPPWGDLSGPSAMFKVLNRSPTIPENLSRLGKDFLSLCFRRDPADRPSASSLLDHPFIRNCDNSEHPSPVNCSDRSQSSRHTLNYSYLPTNSDLNHNKVIIPNSPPHRSSCSTFQAFTSRSTTYAVDSIRNFV